MRRLLNTIYITDENMYLTLDGENLVCKLEGETRLRIPFDNVENIVCFNYVGCSPALMGKCVKKLIPINFISPQGKFLAKVCGETKGNVFLRVQQIDTVSYTHLDVYKRQCSESLRDLTAFCSQEADVTERGKEREHLLMCSASRTVASHLSMNEATLPEEYSRNMRMWLLLKVLLNTTTDGFL